MGGSRCNVNWFTREYARESHISALSPGFAYPCLILVPRPIRCQTEKSKLRRQPGKKSLAEVAAVVAIYPSLEPDHFVARKINLLPCVHDCGSLVLTFPVSYRSVKLTSSPLAYPTWTIIPTIRHGRPPVSGRSSCWADIAGSPSHRRYHTISRCPEVPVRRS